MQFEAVLLDPLRGHHRRGVGPTPAIATMNAFRKMLRFELPEGREAEADKVDQNTTMNMFLMTNMDDDYYTDPKTLREDVNDTKILIRVDKTKENMYTPVGWVRPIF